jgi:hypothetical protein
MASSMMLPAAWRIDSLRPGKACFKIPVVASQSLTKPASFTHATILPSGAKLTDRIVDFSPLSLATSFAWLMSHRWTTPSKPAVASVLPSRE